MTSTARPSLGHVHLKVRHLDRTVDFYTSNLGFEVTELTRPFAFLSWGDRHHDLALQELGPDTPHPGAGVGLYHVAFEVSDERTLSALYYDLRDDGVAVTPVDHGISKALYFDDPGGIGLEVYLDTRSHPDQQWDNRSTPFDPTVDCRPDRSDSSSDGDE